MTQSIKCGHLYSRFKYKPLLFSDLTKEPAILWYRFYPWLYRAYCI